jgi:hypothetical protein
VSGEVRNAGDDATAPMIDDLLRLAREHFAFELQIALIFLRESRAGLQLLQVQSRDRRRGYLGRPVRISRNMFGNYLHDSVA